MLVMTTALLLIEAKIQPMLALLHGLLCYMWHSYQGRFSNKPFAASAQLLTIRQQENNLDWPAAQEQQQSIQQLMTASVQSQAPAGDAVIHSCKDDETPSEAVELQAGQHHSGQMGEEDLLTDRQDQMPSSADILRPGHDSFSEQHLQHHRHQQQYKLPPAQQPDLRQMSQQHAASRAARQDNLQAICIKLLLCTTGLQALPCVAWLKQPMHMRQIAGWPDAAACTVVGLHAAFSRQWVR